MDKKEIRQLKNRESAVRSRQKKDDLIEQLREQVKNYNMEIADLKELNQIMRNTMPDCDLEDSLELPSVRHILEPAEFLI